MQNLDKIQKKIKVKFKDRSLLTIALTHKSFDQKNNNEKLEFLGDRVIGLVLAMKLFNLYPNENEGVLDKRFARLVNKNTCCQISWSLGLQDYIRISDTKKKISLKDEKILSDSCEALIGAIYIDKGYDFVKNYVIKVWKKHLDKSTITVLDSKTKLQEYSLKYFKKLPNYKLINSSGPRHQPIYKIAVNITHSKKFIGTGNSKQEAELDGASKLLKNLNIT